MKIFFWVATILVLAFSMPPAGIAGASPIRIWQTKDMTVMENGLVRGVFRRVDGRIQQTFLASKNGRWIPAAHSWPGLVGVGDVSSNLPSPLYNSAIDPANRLLVSEIVREIRPGPHSSSVTRVILSGSKNGATVEESIELGQSDSFFHIEASARLQGQKPHLEYLLVPFEFEPQGKPDFTCAPTFKPTADSVIGNRVFFAPEVCMQKDSLFAALIPDVDLINRCVVRAKGARRHPDSNSFPVPVDPDSISMPTALDLVVPSESSGRTVFAYGMLDYIVHQHVWFEHPNTPGAMTRELSTNFVRIGMDLLLNADARPGRGFAAVPVHQWRRFGSKWFSQPRPQAMPDAEYARTFYPRQFAYQGYDVLSSAVITHRHLPGHEMDVWQQWDEAGVPMGGLRLYAPQWYQFIANLGWWNNVCDATGLYYWGNRLGQKDWIDHARRMVNLALSAPQNEGIFPGLYDLREHRWRNSLWRIPLEGYNPGKRESYWDNNSATGADYQTASASVTAGYLLQYRRTCEDNEGILSFVRRYGDFLATHIQRNGCVPAWFDPALRPAPSMTWNADGGAHVWVLAELYLVTHEEKYLQAAQRIAQTLIDDVLPKQRWADFEAFYSCAVKPETFLDERTGQGPCNTMSMSWALQGFLSLHEATGDKIYLDAAETTADYASLFQAIWAPHYIITAYPFGGFSSQHGDSEWLDQRAHRFADPFVRLGLLTGRQDLVERGIAAARSSLTLGSDPRHAANGIYVYTNFPEGIGPENIDHEGFPQMPLASGPSWNTVGGLAGIAHVLNRLGGIYLDCHTGLAVGVDGVKVAAVKRDGKTVRLVLEDQLAELPLPFDRAYTTTLRVAGLPDDGNPDCLDISWISPKVEHRRAKAQNGEQNLDGASDIEKFTLQVQPGGQVNVIR